MAFKSQYCKNIQIKDHAKLLNINSRNNRCIEKKKPAEFINSLWFGLLFKYSWPCIKFNFRHYKHVKELMNVRSNIHKLQYQCNTSITNIFNFVISNNKCDLSNAGLLSGTTCTWPSHHVTNLYIESINTYKYCVLELHLSSNGKT